MTIEKIADDGVTFTYEMSGPSGEHFAKEISLRYGQQSKIDLPNQSTLVAELAASE